MLGLQQHTNILFSVTGADPGFHNVEGGGGGGWRGGVVVSRYESIWGPGGHAPPRTFEN